MIDVEHIKILKEKINAIQSCEIKLNLHGLTLPSPSRPLTCAATRGAVPARSWAYTRAPPASDTLCSAARGDSHAEGRREGRVRRGGEERRR